MPPRLPRLAALAAFAILCCLRLAAKDEKTFVMPRTADAKTYPAHDTSGAEKVTVAADPYDSPEKTQKVFRIKYNSENLLPVLLTVTNDAGQPVALTDMQVELVTSRRVKLHPATEDDVYRRVARPPMHGDRPPGNPLPFPRKVKSSLKKDEQQEIQDSRFAAKAVEAHASQNGFFFFDVEGLSDPIAGAHLYVSGLRNGQGQELIFFDIPLDNYVQRAGAH